MRTEEQFYQRALDEILQKRLVSATFAKAFALADGDDNRTRAAYIRLRVAQFEQQAEAEAMRSADVVATERSNRLRRLGDIDALVVRLRPRFGSKVHVVDKSRDLNADVPLAELITEFPRYSASAIYYDRDAHAFLPLERFGSVIEGARTNG